MQADLTIVKSAWGALDQYRHTTQRVVGSSLVGALEKTCVWHDGLFQICMVAKPTSALSGSVLSSTREERTTRQSWAKTQQWVTQPATLQGRPTTKKQNKQDPLWIPASKLNFCCCSYLPVMKEFTGTASIRLAELEDLFVDMKARVSDCTSHAWN
jgi:hypothetical protein